MCYAVVFSFFYLLGIASMANIETENNVLVLDPYNFNETVNSNELIMVKFYAPWCAYCKSFAPEYAKAAGLLKGYNSKIKFAKIDAVEYHDLALRNGFGGYPTLKFFKSGQSLHYNGGRTADGIISWVQKNSGLTKPNVDYQEKILDVLYNIVDDATIAVAGHPADDMTKTTINILKMAIKENFLSYTFGIATKPDVSALQNVSQNVIMLFKPLNNGDLEVMRNYLELEGIIHVINGIYVPFLVPTSIVVVPFLFPA